MTGKNRIDWDFLKRRIQRGKLTPIIGDRVGHRGFLTSDKLIQDWALKVGYPMTNTRNITRIAQYRSITRDRLAANEEFLEFLKKYLIDEAWEQKLIDEEVLETLEDEIDELHFSEVASRLNYPSFIRDPKNPLSVLAKFNIPIYITTSYHPFMAQALSKVTNKAKKPRIETCPWYIAEPNKRSLLDQDDYKDDFMEPVIYHLHGIDTQPESLVFSEDDYLDFLIKTTQDDNVIPKRIMQALADSSLLMLGYELTDWDFRVLFRGLIRNAPSARRKLSVCIQLDPADYDKGDPREIERYLSTYFREYKFDIYWGSIESFSEELWSNLGEA